MGAEEVALLALLRMIGQAGTALFGRIAPKPTNVWAAAAVAVGIQVSTDVTLAATAVLVAANAEFAATNSGEKTFVAAVNALPSIS